MKQRKTGFLMLLSAVSVLFFVFTLYSAIADSKHDLSSGSTGLTDKSTDEDQICVFCHTPHQATTTADPLWNHWATNNNTAYGVYASATLDAADLADIGNGGALNTSLMCMSCHDGTIAVNDLYNPANDTGGDPAMGSGNELDANAKIQTAAKLGTDLTDDHPVNFTYNVALYNAEGGVTGGLKDPLSAAVSNILIGDKVQCASCHDVHDNTYAPFLRVSQTDSGLCTTCHNK